MAKLPQQRRAPRRVVDGVLFLDKPVGISSNNALQKARWLLNAAKGGHTGTLDPMASGLLPLTLGEATKFSQTLLDADKAYDATVLLGVTTTTADAEGEVLARCPVMVSDADIEAALVSLRGEIEQVPPMYSALKHHGKALYEYARAGVEIAREPRRVTIHRFEMLERDVALAQHYSRALSLVALDIDGIKAINEAHGHLTGDQVIKELARRTLSRIDRFELLCRYEGTQFMLLLPECDHAQALARGEELRHAICAESVRCEEEIVTVTVSAGVATLDNEADAAGLIRVTQEAVQRAKKHGRNRTEGKVS